MTREVGGRRRKACWMDSGWQWSSKPWEIRRWSATGQSCLRIEGPFNTFFLPVLGGVGGWVSYHFRPARF